jgi:hypothetical protein
MLLGNMWSQKWPVIHAISSPFPGKAKHDVTPTMVKQVGKASNTAPN